jgi:pentatricopeptide repeat protein
MCEKDKFNKHIEDANDAFYDEFYLQAVSHYNKALALHELDVDSYINMAICYQRNSMYDEALSFFKKALQLEPENTNSIKIYSNFLFFDLEEWSSAEENYINLIEKFPQEKTLYISFATLYDYYYENWAPNYEKAVSIIKMGVKKFADDEYLLSKLMDLYVLWGNLKEARKLFNKLMKNEKLTFEHYKEYAKFFREETKQKYLITTLNRCISNYPLEGQFLEELIELYTKKEDINRVVSTYEKLFKIDCDNINNYYNLAEYLLEKGEINRSTHYYKIAAEISYSKVLFQQAYVFSNPPYDNYTKAIELYKEVVKLNPNNFKAYVNMGACAGFLQQYHQSLSCYTKAIEINPYYDIAYENSGNAFRKTGDLKKAISFYEKALQLNPENYKVAGNLGVTYYSLEKYQESLKFYEISIEFSGNQSIQAYYNIALLYNKLKKHEKAVDACEKALNLYGDDTSPELLYNKYAIHYTLGLATYYLEQKDDSLVHFFDSLELNKNYKDTYVNIGCIYNDLNKLELAKKHLNDALQMDPEDFYILEELGRNSYLEKDYTTALKYTKKSVKLNSKSADGFYNMGKIYSATKKEAQAKKMFLKAESLGHKKE